MKKNIIVILCILFSSLFSVLTDAKNKNESEQWRYDIECAGAGSEGTFLVKVWSYGKKGNIPTDDVKKNAVHGVLFKGVAGGPQGCTAQKALVRNGAVQHEKADFFETFFGKEGTYLKYASVTSSTPEVIKLGKNEYKVGYIISVSKDQLRKDIESAGIIKSLSSGF